MKLSLNRFKPIKIYDDVKVKNVLCFSARKIKSILVSERTSMQTSNRKHQVNESVNHEMWCGF